MAGPADHDFHDIVRRCPDGFALVQGARYLFVNPAWCAQIGQPPEALLGQSLLTQVHEDDRERLTQLTTEALSGNAEIAFVLATGARVFLELLAFVAVPAGEGVEAVVALVARDVTHLKRTQAERLLADRMMSVGTLAAGVAHEINNPLSYVLGNLSYLIEDLERIGADPSARQDALEALREAHEGAERVRRIVRDLQAFSRADQEKLKPIDLNRVIESAVNMAWIEIRHRMRLQKDHGALPLVRANEARLGQVVLNFLLHAAQRIPEGKADQHTLRLRTRGDAGRVILEITDNGPPIPDELLRHLFDAWPHQSMSSAGLGLSMAHSIVIELKGSITVESRAGETTFKIQLPAMATDEASATDLPAVVTPLSGGISILVIDDEPLIAASLKRALRSQALEVVASGRAAIDLLSVRRDFDVIFCDLMMPELTGMDVYEWVQLHVPGLEDAIVFMTGGTFTPRAQAFLETVDCPTLEKPFEVEQVRRVVDQTIRRRRLSLGK